MALEKDMCPGSQELRQPVPEEYPCPQCGQRVEIWTNESQRRCFHCGTMVTKEAIPTS